MIAAMIPALGTQPNRSNRLLLSIGVTILLLAGAGYTWTFTPSYSLYQIKRALETHDYELFCQYVNVDRVLDHAFDEFTDDREFPSEKPMPSSPLARALRKGLRSLARSARDIVKAGLSIAVEQAVKNQEHPPPQIPGFAVVAALWQGQRDGDMVSLPVKIRKKGQIEVKMQQTATGTWQVVEVSNLSVLLPTLKSRSVPDQPKKW
jgi:hypothetical protein